MTRLCSYVDSLKKSMCMLEDLATWVLASEPQKKGFKSIWMEIIFGEGVCESKMKLNLVSFIPEVVVLNY